MSEITSEDDTVRRSLLLATLFRLLAGAPDPVPAPEALRRLEAAVPFTEHEQSLNASGQRRAYTYLRFRVGHARAVGWMPKSGPWSVTPEGKEALDAASSDDDLRKTLQRLYNAVRKQRSRDAAARETDVKFAKLASALSVVEPGWWVSYGDLAQASGLSAQTVGTYMTNTDQEGAYRVLSTDGKVSEGFRWGDPNRADLPEDVLLAEGVEFDDEGRASQAQRLTVWDLEELLAETDGSAPGRRAWLVRGSNVNGKNLVPVWLERGSVSIAASQIRLLNLPLTRAELDAVVQADYAQKSYTTKSEKVTELDLFCNRIQAGDLVLTSDGGEFYVGDVTGEATWVRSEDERSNLRRTVQWRNPAASVDLTALPAGVQPKLSGQHTIVDLTSELAVLDALSGHDEEATKRAEKTAAPELEGLPPAPADLAEKNLVAQDWLQRQIDLLWHRKQIVFYGPPGTGKTHLALAIAHHIAREPSAVKLVQFHPAFSYEDFFEGYRPVASGESGTVAFKLTSGPFRRLVDAARDNPSTPYVLIIDEFNRANLAKVFGELYFLLEYRDRAIDLLYSTGDQEPFTMPDNVFIIGTMNTADRSIALVDAAIRRRFAFVALHPAKEPTRSMLSRWLAEQGKPATNALVLDHLNALIEDDEFQIGPTYFFRPEVYLEGGLASLWETSILPLLEEHHFGEGLDVAKVYSLDSILKKASPDPEPTIVGAEPVPEPEE